MAPSKCRKIFDRKDSDVSEFGDEFARSAKNAGHCECLSDQRNALGVCLLDVWYGIRVDLEALAKNALLLDHTTKKQRRIIRLGVNRFSVKESMYHLLTLRWITLFTLFVVVFMSVVGVFGFMLYTCSFGVLNNASEKHVNWKSHDYFNLSFHTFTTIGYGYLAPEDVCMNWVVVIEAFVSLLFLATLTGIAFAKFAKPRAQLIFSDKFVIAQHGDSLALKFRVVNATKSKKIHQNEILDAHFRVTMIRVQRTQTGDAVLCTYDLPLVQTNYISLRLMATLVHVIDAQSPFYGLSRQDIQVSDFQIYIVLSGIDSTLHDTIHEQHVYSRSQLQWAQDFIKMIKNEEHPAKGFVVTMDYAKLSSTRDVHMDPRIENGTHELAGVNMNFSPSYWTTLSHYHHHHHQSSEQLLGTTTNLSEDLSTPAPVIIHEPLSAQSSIALLEEFSEMESEEDLVTSPKAYAATPLRKSQLEIDPLNELLLSSNDDGSSSSPNARSPTRSSSTLVLEGDDEQEYNNNNNNSSGALMSPVGYAQAMTPQQQMTPDDELGSRVSTNPKTSLIAQRLKKRLSFQWKKTLKPLFKRLHKKAGLNVEDLDLELADSNKSTRKSPEIVHVHHPSRLVFARSVYYRSLEIGWLKLLLAMMLLYFVANATFAAIAATQLSDEHEVIQNINESIEQSNSTYQTLFFFSVQTMSTIGYGELSPNPDDFFINFIVVINTLFGIAAATFVTGITWAKFAIPQSESIVFSNNLLFSTYHVDTPAIIFRVGNVQTYGQTIECTFRLAIIKTNLNTGERDIFDLDLVQSMWPMFHLVSTIVHLIDESSPLFGLSYDDFVQGRVLFVVLFNGLDTTLDESIFRRKTYAVEDIVVGWHFVDIVTMYADRTVVDFTKLHSTESDPEVPR